MIDLVEVSVRCSMLRTEQVVFLESDKLENTSTICPCCNSLLRVDKYNDGKAVIIGHSLTITSPA